MPDSLQLTSVRSSRRSGFSTRTCSWRTGTNRPPNPPPSPTTAKQVCAVSDETCLAFEFPLLTSTRWNYTDILTPQSDGLRWVQLQPEINHWQTNGAGVSFSYLWMAAGRLLEGLCFYRSAGEKQGWIFCSDLTLWEWRIIPAQKIKMNLLSEVKAEIWNMSN